MSCLSFGVQSYFRIFKSVSLFSRYLATLEQEYAAHKKLQRSARERAKRSHAARISEEKRSAAAKAVIEAPDEISLILAGQKTTAAKTKNTAGMTMETPGKVITASKDVVAPCTASDIHPKSTVGFGPRDQMLEFGSQMYPPVSIFATHGEPTSYATPVPDVLGDNVSPLSIDVSQKSGVTNMSLESGVAKGTPQKNPKKAPMVSKNSADQSEQHSKRRRVIDTSEK